MVKKYIFLFSSFLFIVLFSCKKADIKFGDEILDNELTQIIRNDTFGVTLSTVYLDSFATSAKGVTLLGNYSDPIFGKVATQTFCELTPPAYEDKYAKTTFDSLYLIFRINKNNYYGDTTQPIQIDIHRLKDSIYLPTNKYAFYNRDKFDVLPTPLASTSAVIKPRYTDSIVIRLPDSLGIEFLTKLQKNTNKEFKTNRDFISYFKGLRISSSNSNCIVGCTDNITMRLTYRSPGLYPTHLNFDCTVSDKTHHFTNIAVDRTNSTVPILNSINHNNNEVSSYNANNAAYSQPTTGLMAKLRFPTIRGLLQFPNFAKILYAQLVIRPVKLTFTTTNKTFYLPSQLRLNTTTVLNQLGADVVTYASNGQANVEYGNLFIDYQNGQNSAYTYDVTNYIKSIINDGSINRNGLLLIPPSPAFETQFPRVVIGNNKNLGNNTQLIIYYASVQ